MKRIRLRNTARRAPFAPPLSESDAHPNLPRRTQRIVWGGGAVAILILSAAAYLLANTLDFQHLERERRLLRTGFAEVIDAVPVAQESATIWDDAVRETRSGNRLWMQENLGEWMGSYFGFNAALVLDENNQPIHVMREGVTEVPALRPSEEAALAPLIAELRSDIAAAAVENVLPYQDGAELGRMAIVELADEPVVISIKPIVPGSPNLLLPADQVYLHAAIQNLDAELLLSVSEHFELGGLTLVPPGSTSLGEPLMGSNGETLGLLVWQPEQPAMQLLGRLFPFAVVSGVALMALATWLLGRLRQTTARQRKAEERARYESLHDPLTDLANRDRLNQLIEFAIAGGPVVLHLLDIDRFAAINETMGYAEGDSLLCNIADRLMEAVADTGSVARIGGDEFAVLQRLPAGVKVQDLADRLMIEFSGPFVIAGDQVPISCCLGSATAHENADGRELMRRAHVALAQARTMGRGRRAQFEPGMDDHVLRRNRLERDLRKALAEPGQLSVVYQPILAADGCWLSGAEALVRWKHPVEGNIPPDAFIDIAEDRGLIEALGEHVLRHACAFAVSCDLPWIAVNASPVQLRAAGFYDLVMAVLADTRLEPHRLQLEITEGALLDNTGDAQLTLRRLRQSGIRIALDDFGTGYSSVTYLAKYAVDKIKIDKSFVAQLTTSDQSHAIVRAVIDLAHAFKLDTTAEGVETLEQRERLAALGCQEMQGFLFSRPLEASAFEQYLHGLRARDGLTGKNVVRIVRKPAR